MTSPASVPGLKTLKNFCYRDKLFISGQFKFQHKC